MGTIVLLCLHQALAALRRSGGGRVMPALAFSVVRSLRRSLPFQHDSSLRVALSFLWK